MIDCLLDGGTPEQALAFAGRLKAPREALLAALEGELSDEQRWVAQTLRAHIRFLRSQRADLFRDLVTRRGTKRAIIAIAHRVASIGFVLLSRHVPYQDPTVDYQALAVKKRAPRWIQQLRK